MDVLSIYLHNIRTGPCPGWVFLGDNWLDDTKNIVSDIFKKFINYEQSPGFNYWQLFITHNDLIVASRFTWEKSWIGKTIIDIEKSLKQYYLT